MNRRTFALIAAASPHAVSRGRAVELEARMQPLPEPSSSEFLVGGDVSALPLLEQRGATFSKGGEKGDALTLMSACGCNCFRVRLFVKPTGEGVVAQDVPFAIALAKRFKALEVKWLLDFHYSDTWADPGHQTKPAAWTDLAVEALTLRVYEYTRDSLRQMQAADVLPDFVQVGNEITPGMLWPEGKLHDAGPPERQWRQFAQLVKAGVRGVREVALSTRRQIGVVIHIDKGGNWPVTHWFFDKLLAHEVDFDVIGQSFYPWWHGKLAALQQTVHESARTYGKPVWVVETAYPWRSLAGTKYRLDSLEYPSTPAGQADFTKALIDLVAQAPGGLGKGVLWWYPEAIRTPGMRVWNGGATALFEDGGEALPALSALGRHG